MSEFCYSPQLHSLDNDSCCHDTTDPDYPVEKRRYESRIRRIRGQVRGIGRIVENGEYCIDALTQISAMNSALKSLALTLLDTHPYHCMMHTTEDDQEELDVKLEEMPAAITRLTKQLPEKFRGWEGDVMKRSGEMAVGFRFWLLVAWVMSGIPLKRLVFPGDWHVLGKPGLLDNLQRR